MDRSGKGKFEEEWSKAFEGSDLKPSDSSWEKIEAQLSSKGAEGSIFDQEWKRALNVGEVKPNDEVWEAIDVELVQQENSKMKRRVVFYQRIAAASIGVMLMFASYSWLSNDTVSQNTDGYITDSGSKTTKEIVDNNSAKNQTASDSLKDKATTQSELTESNTSFEENGKESTASLLASGEKNKTTISKSATNEKLNSDQQSASQTSREANLGLTKIQSSTQNMNNNSSSSNDFNGDIARARKTKINKSSFEDVASTSALNKSENENAQIMVSNNLPSSTIVLNNQVPLGVITLLPIDKLPGFFGPNDYSIAYKIADAMPAITKKKKKLIVNENSWAALGFSTGTFIPGAGGNELATSAQRNDASVYSLADFKSSSAATTKNETPKSSNSMSVSLTAGKRIFKRFLLQGGVSYLNQVSNSESEVLNVAPSNQVTTGTAFAPETTNAVTYESKQDINSTFQYLAIPVQLGYMIVDRNFGVQINGGLAPDFFLSNTVYNKSTNLETSNSSGSDEAFKTVSLAGLSSLEISYKFFEHYRISLTPGVRYSLTSVYNDNSLASSKPFVADIGLRFRYIF